MIKPVCGHTGKTYANSCEAQCHGELVYSVGECESTCGCDDHVDLVCGSDLKTYTNKCLAFCNKVKVIYDDACEIQGKQCNHCSKEFKNPVCGKSGTKYDNACFARCAHEEIDPHAACLGGGEEHGYWHFHWIK